MKFSNQATLAAFILVSFASSHAATLVQYDFENSSTPFAASTTIAGLTAGDLSPNTGTTPGNSGFVRSTSGVPAGVATLAISFLNVDDGAAPTDGTAAPDNITFTFTPTGGNTLNLDSLTFLSRLNATLANTPGGTYTVQYDDLSDAAPFQLLNPSFIETGNVAQTRTVDLSSPLFDNLTSGITFRINFTEPAGASTPNATNNSMKLDNLTVNGTVPEPTSAVLAIGGGVFFLVRRRRHRRVASVTASTIPK